MLKKSLLLTLLLALLVPWAANAQSLFSVKADCGGGDISDWSTICEFTPTNAIQLTVNDGTTTNGFVPIYGYWCDNTTKSQFIIPASDLAAMAWGTINKMTFYASNASINWDNAKFEVYMTETEETTVSALADYTTMTKVKNAGSLSISGNQMVVEFDTPFDYTGGNLMIGFLQTVSGTYKSCSWYGVAATGASMGGYGSSISQQNFLPKTTFAYTPGEMTSCSKPTDLAVSDITASSANVNWNGDASLYEMEYGIIRSNTYNFDDGSLQGWTNIIVETSGGQWLHSNDNLGGYNYTGHAHSGTGFAMCYSFVDNGEVSYTTDAYLVSPKSYTISDNASLNFWYDMANDSYPEDFEVCVATTANPTASDFTPIWNSSSAKGGSNSLRAANGSRIQSNTRFNNWREVTLDLNAYVGQTIWIAFHDDNYDMYEVWLDDVTVNAGGEFSWISLGTVTRPYTLSNLDAETSYVVRVRANCGSEGYSAWLQGSFTTLPLCMAPTNLVISNIDKRSADLTWTAIGEETAWQICLNSDLTNLINVTTTSYSFTGLTPKTKYNVQVRAVCDTDLQSAWSAPATFTTLVACPAPTALTVSNITGRSANVSWTYDGDVELEFKAFASDAWKFYDNGVYNTSMGTGGMVYWGMMLPAASLTAGTPLTKVALHTSYAGEATMNIYLGGDQPTGSPAVTQTFTMAGNQDFMEITLDTPVAINGTQNLWITFYQTGMNFPVDACTGPTDPNGRWVSLDGTTWEDIADYGYNLTWMIRAGFGNATTEWVAVNNPASPQTLTGLTPETNYLVRVRAICGGEDGESVWMYSSFTPVITCPTPTALAATPYANSAILNWTGSSESYTVSYRTASYTQGVPEEFTTTGIPSGWTRYNTLLTDDVLNGTTALTTSSSGWSFGTGNGVFDSHARVNLYGTNRKFWLITPAMDVTTGASFSFDLALTAFDGTNVPAPQTTGTDDRFVVLISSDNMATWTILRQWDNAGSEYVLNNIANTATGEQVMFDFSAYAGQTVYVAFYGESTVDNADNNLHIDNVTIGTPVAAGEWQTIHVNEAHATITGLTPETNYEAKVQGDCGNNDLSLESSIVNFTTTNDVCPVPTNLAAANITGTTAELSWNGSPDVESFTVRYKSPDHVVGDFYEAFNSTSRPAGWTEFSGLVNNVIAGTESLATFSGGWSTNSYALGSYNMKANIYGTGCKYWLVTPEVTLTNGNFSFDLALTAYNLDYPASSAGVDDRFVVLVYANNTWTILREWNNSGSADVFNNIPATGEAVSIDLSAYVGQTVKIAFYAESTVTDNGDNDLHIDNVVIGTFIPGTDWQTVTTTKTNVKLTGLTPATPYEAQVKSDCSTDENPWSNTMTFTTDTLSTVTQTITLKAGWNWVNLYVEGDPIDMLDALKAALGDNALQIQGKNEITEFDGEDWFGDLDNTGITNDLTYLIEIADGTPTFQIELNGTPANINAYSITINKGWNWIGFPCATPMDVADAMNGFNAEEGDMIQSQKGTTEFDGDDWFGDLDTFEPGDGLMYFSNSDSTKTLIFNTAKQRKK